MKKTTSTFNYFLFVLVSGGLLLSSCSEDNSDEEETAVEIENAIELAELTAGVSIESATLKDGDPPAPNSTISFKINTAEQDAFLDTGYTISFAANDDIAGAYIRLIDSEGNKAANYFDVPASAFDEKKPEADSKKSKLSSQKLLEEKEYEISVDFKSNIPVGTFCYAICIYDTANNISQISRICVTVQNWGGSADLVGSWLLDRYEPADTDDSFQSVACDDGQSFDAPYENNEKEEWIFTLEANGDYNEIYDDIYYSLDYDASAAQCSAVFEEEATVSKNQYYGKWSYDSQSKSLTVVDFGYVDFNDPTENETYNDGELYLDGVTAEVISGELVITETYTDDGQPVTTKAIFKKQ